MQGAYKLLITSFIVILFNACSGVGNQPWTALVPDEASFLIVPQSDVTPFSLPQTEYASLLEDITESSIQQISAFDGDLLRTISLKGVAIHPSTSMTTDLIWITESKQPIEEWVSQYYQPLAQNYYTFNEVMVHKISKANNLYFIAQVNDWLVISTSSWALESALRSYLGLAPSMQMPTEPAPGQLIMNTPRLDGWVEQFTNVTFRPSIYKAFSGTNPATLFFSNNADSTEAKFTLEGKITLSEETRSPLVESVAYKNSALSLDRYIASNAAAFALLRKAPNMTPQEPEDRVTRLDSLLLNNSTEFTGIANTLGDEFAFEAFPESGLLSSGEFLFMRKLTKKGELRARLYDLATEGYIDRQGDSYYASSSVLASLIGSELCTFKEFYISFSGDVMVISKRRGLSESVEADRARRRVMYYNSSYTELRKDLPTDVSGFVWAKTSEFEQFIKPFLLKDNAALGLFNRFDVIHLTMRKLNDSSIDFSLKTTTEEGFTQPYQELWVSPLNNGELTGTPILGDIVGSATKEIIYATTQGEIYAVAGDGTIVLEASTDGSIPVGSPVLYDWYGNNQPIVMLGAGTKIFAWNQNGSLLPKFPIEIGQRISAPIVVTDVRRNGIPEIIVATEDRQVHVIDGRGENVTGWPQVVNAVITSAPTFERVDDVWSIWAFSQNIVHSWLRSGATRPGYPQFINAGFSGSPVVFNNNVWGAGIDGHLYSVGKNPSISDSLGTFVRMDSVSVKSMYVANNALHSVGVHENVLLRDSTGFYRNDLVSTISQNGSVFMYSPDGSLKLTKTLGQPASKTLHPSIIDIDQDGNDDVIALAEFGRLFAWEVLTGERIYDLPTSGMKFPLITDLNGDGEMELIAQTREGLRCWTIIKQE